MGTIDRRSFHIKFLDDWHEGVCSLDNISIDVKSCVSSDPNIQCILFLYTFVWNKGDSLLLSVKKMLLQSYMIG